MRRLIKTIACSLITLAPLAAMASSFDATCSVYFSPKGGATEAIVRQIGEAKKHINVQAYSYTSKPINAALVAAAARGVQVSVIVDKGQPTARGTQMYNALAGGVDLRLDTSHAIAHNKTMVMDDDITITGSFNFSAAAEYRNSENMLICKSRDQAKFYRENFFLHWEHSTPPEQKVSN